MGQYTAPTFALGYYKAICDNTATDGQILLGPITCVNFLATGLSSALYNGDVKLYLQKTDNSYDWIDHFIGAGVQRVIPPDNATLNVQNEAFKYPFVVKIVVDTHPTLGEVTVWLITTPGPANPLF